ncbi:hypothetical protein IIA79_00650 [bacterium]|nr:hypothetical protein [bacterium]
MSLRSCLLAGLFTALLVAQAFPASAQTTPATTTTTAVETADFFTIAQGRAPLGGWRIYRWQDFPDIYIVHFETYLLQGQTLNRFATYIEKVGTRGTHVSWRQMMHYLHANGLTMENVYGAHDYRTRDMARFFNAVFAAGDRLNVQEQRLLDTLAGLGLLAWDEDQAAWAHTGEQAVLSFATRYLGNEKPSSQVLGQRGRPFEVRALYHETRHGLYFTEPRYAQACRDYWHEVLSEDDRRAFRLLLLLMNYDPADEELIINEWQAYLLTPSYRFIGARALTSRLRGIASGGSRPSSLSSSELNFLIRRGSRLADDIDRWMVRDLRDWLDEEWDVPGPFEVGAF